MVTKRISFDAKDEFILKPSIFGTTIHCVVIIVRDKSETVNLFPFAVTGEVLY